MQWVEAKDAAKHPTVYRTTLATKDYPAPTVNDAGHLRLMRSLSDEKL